VVVLIRVVLVLCKIMLKDSEDTSEHEESFDGGRLIVYEARLFGVGGFLFRFTLLVLLYGNASNNFESALMLILS